MKKVKRSRICTAALIFIFVLLTGCGKEEVKEESKTETFVTEQAEVEIPVPDKQEEMIEIPIEKEPVISAQYTKTVTEAYGNDEITLLTKKVNDISFQIPENEHAQEEINAFFEERNAAWEDTVALYVEVVEADYASWKEQEDGGEWKTHEIGRLYEVKRLDEQMLCVVEDTFVYTGGERTNYVRVAYNFDTWTGQRLSLEEAAAELDEPFLKKGILLVVDGTDPELVRGILETELISIEERHKKVIGFWDTVATMGPAWGMIGTLIGLILMLQNMSDASAIGPAMSVALITTLYGSVLANWICSPTANKLKANSQSEILMKEIMIEGLLSIQAGENPRVIEEKLKSFLAPAERIAATSQEGGE